MHQAIVGLHQEKQPSRSRKQTILHPRQKDGQGFRQWPHPCLRYGQIPFIPPPRINLWLILVRISTNLLCLLQLFFNYTNYSKFYTARLKFYTKESTEVIIYCKPSMLLLLTFAFFMLKLCWENCTIFDGHGDRSFCDLTSTNTFVDEPYKALTKLRIKSKHQFWNHWKNETVYWNVQKSRHIIHWKIANNNNHIWPPKRSMIYVNLSKFKLFRNKLHLIHFNFLFCHILFLIDASYFYTYYILNMIVLLFNWNIHNTLLP